MRHGMMISLAVLLGVVALTAQAATLQFKDAEGASRTFKYVMHVTGAIENGADKTQVNNAFTITGIENVNSVKDNTASLLFDVKEVTVAAKAEGADAKPQNLPAFKLTYDRTALGKVSNIKAEGEIIQFLNAPLDVMNRHLQNLTQLMEFPDKEIKDGDQWESKQTITFEGDNKIELTAKYTLIGAKQADDGKTYMQIDCDVAAKAEKLSFKIGKGDAEKAMTMAIELTGKTTTLFDEAAGEIHSVKATLKHIASATTAGDDAATSKTSLEMDGSMTRTK
ncbi:MAG: DUF6263 family protein [Armatimonadota bacterium]